MQNRLEQKATTIPEAREAYLRARYFFDKDNKEGSVLCLQYFQEAIAKDPNYAAAYAGLAACYDLGTYFEPVDNPATPPKIKAAAMKAVELDDKLGQGHSELADYYVDYDWDFRAAEREYKRALELDPTPAVHRSYGSYLGEIGQADKAIQEMQRAHEQDPLSVHYADDLGWAFLYARRYDDAVDQFHSVFQMDPNFWRSRWGLARTYALKRMYKEAISECLKIPELIGIGAVVKGLFRNRCSLYEKVYSTAEMQPPKRRWFESAQREIDIALKFGDTYFIATLYATSGDDEKALDLLEKGYAEHDQDILRLKVDPRLDHLRSSPRFQDLLRRINLPEE